MSRQRRYAFGLGAAALIGIAVAVILTLDVGGSGEQPASQAVVTARDMTPSPASNPRRRRSWIVEASAVCRLGQKLYPDVVLGADGDPDTTHYAVERLVSEISALSVPTAASVRRQRLAQHGQAAVSAWRSIAIRPIGDVTLRERQEAEMLAAQYVDELIAFGADACRPLRVGPS